MAFWHRVTIEISDMREFVAAHQAKFPKVVECLLKDKKELVTFYGFLAEHWASLQAPATRSKSAFTTVRLRIYKTKGSGSRMAFLAMAVKLVESAQNNWRKTELQRIAARGDRRNDLQRWNEARPA
jgi:hypothetical protein